MKKMGFTLVELLAVLAILAILMSLAAFSVVNVLNNQKNVLADEMEKNLTEAAVSYVEKKHIRLSKCSTSFNEQNPTAIESDNKCYQYLTVEQVIEEGLFTDGEGYCNKEGKILVYKKNYGNYSEIKAEAEREICKQR